MHHRSQRREYNTIWWPLQLQDYLETLLTYGSDAALSHLTTAHYSYWYKDDGNTLPCDPTKVEESTNTGFIARWNTQKQSKEIEMHGLI